MKCWKEHFETHLNTEFPHDEAEIHKISDVNITPFDNSVCAVKILSAVNV